jgi:hypothetical protein
MTIGTGSDAYRHGVELVEAGRYEEGWDCFRTHLRDRPQDVQALNDAGAVLHYLGRTEEALGLLTQARQLQADSVEIAENLVEIYLAAGRAVEATQLFDDLERRGALSIELLNRTATLLLDQGNKGSALNVLLRSQRLWPDQEMLRPILPAIRAKRPQIAFFRAGPGEDSTRADLGQFVQQRFRTEFYESQDPAGMEKLLQESDIAWFDGGGHLAVVASRRGGSAKLVISLRPSDMRDRWAQDMSWENVSVLVPTGNLAVEEMLLAQVPDLRRRTRLVVVPYGVNLRRYALRRRDRGKHLACIDGLTLEANPAFLLQCMQKLHYLDPEYRLSCAGTFESPLLEQYVRHMVRTLDLTGVVSFESRPGDWNAWLSDKHFIVGGGLGDSQMEGLLLGMACGLKPVVHHFPGADKLLPPQHLFSIAEQFCQEIRAGDYRPAQYRRWVEERYPLEPRWKTVEDILGQLETEIELQAAVASKRETVPASGPREALAAGDGRR